MPLARDPGFLRRYASMQRCGVCDNCLDPPRITADSSHADFVVEDVAQSLDKTRASELNSARKWKPGDPMCVRATAQVKSRWRAASRPPSNLPTDAHAHFCAACERYVERLSETTHGIPDRNLPLRRAGRRLLKIALAADAAPDENDDA